MTAEKIGQRLSISAGTVRTHIYRLLRKLNARDRAHAVALSFRMSLLSVQHSAGPAEHRFCRPN
jgi:DNA-binding CsgD family transcriptional regulator